jgi:transposase
MHDGQAEVTGGVDTHGEQHVAAVVDAIGKILGTAAFAADAAGYRRLLRWMGSFGEVARVGVEGTGAYGAGLARYRTGQGVRVVEVNRPDRQARRRRGKSDTTDAEAAARAALNGEACGLPKAGDGPVEAMRTLRVARRSAMKARTQAANQIRDLIVTAPDDLRAQLCKLGTSARVRLCARFRPGQVSDPAQAARWTLRCLARRHQALTAEIDELDHSIGRLCAQTAPALLAARGVGPEVASVLLIAASSTAAKNAAKSNVARASM